MTADRYAVGLLSGTSLDGIDACCCRVTGDGASGPRSYDLELLAFRTEPFPEAVRTRVAEACGAEGRVETACRLHVELGELFAAAASAVVSDAGVAPEAVTVVGSHGQTVRHAPTREPVPGTDVTTRATLQLGDGDVIAARTGIETVADFRARDVAVGGHGAPLAPFLDLALLTDDDEFRIAQNIGGIGNCTLLPPGAGRADVTAFDTGPGNMVIDGVVSLLTDGARTYDEDGEMAAAGTVCDDLVQEHLDAPFFRRPPPKTTGREAFGADYARKFVEAGRARGLTDVDIVASATALTADSIARAYADVDAHPDRVILSGGGAQNPTLVEMLRQRLDCPVDRADAHGVDVDAKEALLFALLGITHLDAVPGNVPSATGADAAVRLGKRCPGDND